MGSDRRKSMKIRPRIAIVTPAFPTQAEPYRGIYNYRAALALQKWADVEVFCLIPAYPRLGRLRPRSRSFLRADGLAPTPGVTAHYFEYPALPVLSRPFNASVCGRVLREALPASRPDLVLAYWLHPEGLGAVRAGSALGIPAVVVALGSDLRLISDPFARRGVRKALLGAAAAITVSDELRDQAIALGAAPEHVTAILNGCDSSVFRPASRRAAREALGIDLDAKLVLFVGRLAAVKGLPELFDAVASLRADEKRLELVIVGQGELEERMRARAATADLSGRVRFQGSEEPARVAQWMAAADLLCLPSHSEGCPNVVLETLLCGRPVVASRVGGIPELVDETCAVLVPPGDGDALARGLGEALSRSWDESAIAARPIRTWDDVGRETFAVCQTVLAARANGNDRR